VGAWTQAAISARLDRLHQVDGALAGVDRAVAVLRATGATGRGATRFGSLGLHFNVDPPGLDAGALVTVLRAYLLLEPWLRREAAGGGTRGPSFLCAPYPAGYVRRVLAPDYRPALADLAGDYLAANPTRDRGLDLLPVLLHLDAARVRARLPREKIGGRPALHYRLARAHVGEPGWGVAAGWNGWAAVERLAADRDRLAALGRARLGLGGTEETWLRRTSSTAFSVS
jgi:putative amidoligase enzyme